MLCHGDAGGLAGLGLVLGGGVEAFEGFEDGAFGGGVEDELIPQLEGAAGKGAGYDAAVVAHVGEFVDVLDGEAHGLVGEGAGFLEGVEGLQEGGSIVPGQLAVVGGDACAFATADGDVVERLDADAGEVGVVFVTDAREDGLVIADEVHFVDEDDDFFDAEHPEQVAMAAGVFLDAFFGVDDEDGGFGVGGAGDHVFDEFDVAGGVDDDVVAFFRLEEDAGGVDGDGLGLFVFEGVDQEGVFEGDALGGAAGADAFKFAFGEGVGVGEQAADDGAFAVVDVADEDDVHLFFVGVEDFFHFTCTLLYAGFRGRRRLLCPGRDRRARRCWRICRL